MTKAVLLLVPAVIALLIVGAIVYTFINDPTAEIPEAMANALTLILGYYFGVGASGRINE